MKVFRFFRHCGLQPACVALAVAAGSVEVPAADTKAKPAAKDAAKAPAKTPAKVEKDWLAPVRQAAVLRSEDKRDEALALLRTANREIKQEFGEDSPHLVPVNNLAATILIDQGQVDAAESLVEKTMALHELLIGARKVASESIGKTLVVSARIDLLEKRFLAAIDKAAQALPLVVALDGPRGDDVAPGSEILEASAESLEQLLGPGDPMTAEARAKAAGVFEKLGRLDQAIAQRKGLFRSASSRNDQAATDDAAEKLGRLMGMAGRAPEAVAILETGAANSPTRLRLLGDLQLAANQLLTADASFKAAIDADAASSAKQSAIATASDRLRRLLVADRRGRVSTLPDWLEPTLAGLVKTTQGEMATAIKGIVAGSNVLVSLGRPEAAVTRLAEALMMARKNAPKAPVEKTTGRAAPPAPVKATPPSTASTPVKPTPQAQPTPPPKTAAPGNATASGKPTTPTPPASSGKAPPPPPKGRGRGASAVLLVSTPATAEVAGHLAAACFMAGNTTAALSAAQTELPPAIESLGPGDGRVTLLRAMAAGAAAGQGDIETASNHATQALAYGLPRPDDAWEEILTTVFDRLATSDAKTDWRGEYVAARARQFGPNHPHVASAWGLFGASRLAAGDWPAAVTCFTKAVDLRSATLGPEHPETAASLTLLAHAQRAGGNPVKGAKTAAEAVALLEKSVGGNHPATLEAIDVLAAARLQAGDVDGVAALLERLCASEAMADPVRRAYHLTRLAEVTAVSDPAAARTRVQSAMALPCWTADKDLTVAQRRNLADTAAYATRVYRMLGEESASQPTLLKARSIAIRLDESGSLIDRMERLATPKP